jgi:hypothetical protein
VHGDSVSVRQMFLHDGRPFRVRDGTSNHPEHE